MEQNQESLFGLNIDQMIRSHLTETARWTKFLAIVGFIMCGLILIGGIFFATRINTLSNQYGYYRNTPGPGGMGALGIVIYVLIAVVCFFPPLFLFRFSDKMKTALAANNQVDLTTSFQNLKVYFRYIGVLTIIALAFYLLAILVIASSR